MTGGQLDGKMSAAMLDFITGTGARVEAQAKNDV